MSEYFEKLKDPRWQQKRLRIFERDGWRCLCCGNKDNTLHVHHLIYSKGEPWDAPDDALETLCEYCHEWREDFNRLGERRTLIPTRFCYAFFRFACARYPDQRCKNDLEYFARFWNHLEKCRMQHDMDDNPKQECEKISNNGEGGAA